MIDVRAVFTPHRRFNASATLLHGCERFLMQSPWRDSSTTEPTHQHGLSLLTPGPYAGERRPVLRLRRGGEKADNLCDARHTHDLAPDVDRLRFEEAGFGDIDDGEISSIEEETANLVTDAIQAADDFVCLCGACITERTRCLSVW